jgi:hypothetical protein
MNKFNAYKSKHLLVTIAIVIYEVHIAVAGPWDGSRRRSKALACVPV